MNLITYTLDASHFDNLLKALSDKGYTLMGPTVDESAIVPGEIRCANDLPLGWTDVQGPGYYRLNRSEDPRYFDFNVGPKGWKQFFFPPEEPLWRACYDENGLVFEETRPEEKPLALIGVRACELAALATLDKVYGEGPYRDERYMTRRRNSFVVAVNCTRAGETCFCTSMDTGPKASSGFDLALTEQKHDTEHYFLLEAGSTAGEELLAALDPKPAEPAATARGNREIEHTAASMGRSLDTEGLPQRLQQHAEDPRWQQVADRCLSCGNCTLVCPTCFCNTVTDKPDLEGTASERVRLWDSCFNADFSYIHGGSIRGSVRSRYRQWLTHKLSTWMDQFDTLGCVGCGRCITWCPVGIDLTEEAAHIGGGDHGET